MELGRLDRNGRRGPRRAPPEMVGPAVGVHLNPPQACVVLIDTATCKFEQALPDRITAERVILAETAF